MKTNVCPSAACMVSLATKPLEYIAFAVWFLCVLVFVEDVVVLAHSRRPVPPSSGKTLFALADAPWMQVLKSSLPPPPSSGETGTTSFRKKEKKFLEFQAPWNYFVRQELSSETPRFHREVESLLKQFGALLWRVVALERSACVLRDFLDLARLWGTCVALCSVAVGS